MLSSSPHLLVSSSVHFLISSSPRLLISSSPRLLISSSQVRPAPHFREVEHRLGRRPPGETRPSRDPHNLNRLRDGQKRDSTKRAAPAPNLRDAHVVRPASKEDDGRRAGYLHWTDDDSACDSFLGDDVRAVAAPGEAVPHQEGKRSARSGELHHTRRERERRGGRVLHQLFTEPSPHFHCAHSLLQEGYAKVPSSEPTPLGQEEGDALLLEVNPMEVYDGYTVSCAFMHAHVHRFIMKCLE